VHTRFRSHCRTMPSLFPIKESGKRCHPSPTLRHSSTNELSFISLSLPPPFHTNPGNAQLSLSSTLLPIVFALNVPPPLPLCAKRCGFTQTPSGPSYPPLMLKPHVSVGAPSEEGLFFVFLSKIHSPLEFFPDTPHFFRAAHVKIAPRTPPPIPASHRFPLFFSLFDSFHFSLSFEVRPSRVIRVCTRFPDCLCVPSRWVVVPLPQGYP